MWILGFRMILFVNILIPTSFPYTLDIDSMIPLSLLHFNYYEALQLINRRAIPVMTPEGTMWSVIFIPQINGAM